MSRNKYNGNDTIPENIEKLMRQLGFRGFQNPSFIPVMHPKEGLLINFKQSDNVSEFTVGDQTYTVTAKFFNAQSRKRIRNWNEFFKIGCNNIHVRLYAKTQEDRRGVRIATCTPCIIGYDDAEKGRTPIVMLSTLNSKTNEKLAISDQLIADLAEAFRAAGVTEFESIIHERLHRGNRQFPYTLTGDIKASSFPKPINIGNHEFEIGVHFYVKDTGEKIHFRNDFNSIGTNNIFARFSATNDDRTILLPLFAEISDVVVHNSSCYCVSLKLTN